MIVKVTSEVRVKILLLSASVLVLLPIWTLLLVHYFIWPLPQLFSSPSLIPNKTSKTIKQFRDIDFASILQNSLLICLFFLQHIVMASLKYKFKLKNVYKNFPIYERLIYNITSSLCVIFVFLHQKPQHYVLFQHSWCLSAPILVISFVVLASANMSMERSLMLPYTYRQLFVVNQIRLSNYEDRVSQGITCKFPYSLIRHPMQAAVIWAFTLGNPVITLEKVAVMGTMIGGIIWGVLKEEDRLQKQFLEYPKYRKTVKARFIPYSI